MTAARTPAPHGPAPRIGVLGLGRMGAPIAGRLAALGPVAAYDPVVDAAAGSAAALASAVDVLVTVLPGPVEARTALLDDGALAALPPGALWIDLTSNDPAVADELGARAADAGVAAAAAPMIGGPAHAAAGALRFALAGADDAAERAADILAPLGRVLAPRAGTRLGAAHLVKLLGNALWFGEALAVAEAVVVARRAGLAPDTLVALLEQGPGASVFLTGSGGALLGGDPLATFGLHRVVEELDTVERLATASGLPPGALAHIAAAHRAALAEYGPVDGELLGARLVEQRARASQDPPNAARALASEPPTRSPGGMSDAPFPDDLAPGERGPDAPDGPDIEHFIVGSTGQDRLLQPDRDAIIDDVDIDPEAVVDETDVDPEVAGRRDEGDPI